MGFERRRFKKTFRKEFRNIEKTSNDKYRALFCITVVCCSVEHVFHGCRFCSAPMAILGAFSWSKEPGRLDGLAQTRAFQVGLTRDMAAAESRQALQPGRRRCAISATRADRHVLRKTCATRRPIHPKTLCLGNSSHDPFSLAPLRPCQGDYVNATAQFCGTTGQQAASWKEGFSPIVFSWTGSGLVATAGSNEITISSVPRGRWPVVSEGGTKSLAPSFVTSDSDSDSTESRIILRKLLLGIDFKRDGSVQGA